MTRLPLLRFTLPLAALVAATPAFAQAPLPPPGAPPAPGAASPPPGGPTVIFDHNSGVTHVDVHCTQAETTQACSDLAARLYDRLNGAVPTK